jgi:predicted RNA binding protein YcfA (HicA-like mRNA interferase family)
MGKYNKLRAQILQGTADTNISFNDLCQLLSQLGFDERTRGSHHVFRRANLEERINLQRQSCQTVSSPPSTIHLKRYRLGSDE